MGESLANVSGAGTSGELIAVSLGQDCVARQAGGDQGQLQRHFLLLGKQIVHGRMPGASPNLSESSSLGGAG